MLLFAPESHYWLTGYDTFGYCFFQCLVLTRDGRLHAAHPLRRPPPGAAHLADREHRRLGRPARAPARRVQLRELLDDLGLLGGRIGVEYDTHGLTAANGRALDEALRTFGTIEDASDLVPRAARGEEPGRDRLCRAAPASSPTTRSTRRSA